MLKPKPSAKNAHEIRLWIIIMTPFLFLFDKDCYKKLHWFTVKYFHIWINNKHNIKQFLVTKIHKELCMKQHILINMNLSEEEINGLRRIFHDDAKDLTISSFITRLVAAFTLAPAKTRNFILELASGTIKQGN